MNRRRFVAFGLASVTAICVPCLAAAYDAAQGTGEQAGLTRTLFGFTPFPYDLIIAAAVSGSGGINKTGTGALLLSGNNTYTGDTVLTAGALAAGSDTAFGTSRLDLPTSATSLVGTGGARTLGNAVVFSGAAVLGSTFNLGGLGTLDGGGNNLKLTGPANLTGGITTLNIPVAATVEFAGGLGEMSSASALNKTGFGTLTLSADSPYSGPTTIAPNGGTILLTGNGAARNTAVTVNPGGVLQVGDFATAANPGDRLGDNIPVTLAGGTLALAWQAASTTTESLSLTLAAGTASTVRSLVGPGSSATTRIVNFARNSGSLLD